MSRELTLYAVPGSHPCVTVELALRRKGLAYRRVDRMSGIAMLQQRLAFGKRTVPGLQVGSEKVVGSRLCCRAIEGLEPDPPLVPRDAALRAKVEAAELWGDEVLQEEARWITVAAVAAQPESAQSFLEASTLPRLPDAIAVPATKVLFAIEPLVLGHGPERLRGYLQGLPERLDRVDALLEEGVIGRDVPNVADFQIAPSLRLLMCLDDLRPKLASRPCGQWALDVVPDYPGNVPTGSLA